jgi:hypothetical protein
MAGCIGSSSAEPFSTSLIPSEGPSAVLELNAGQADKIGLKGAIRSSPEPQRPGPVEEPRRGFLLKAKDYYGPGANYVSSAM